MSILTRWQVTFGLSTKFMFSDGLSPGRAAPFCQKSAFPAIAFTVSKYSSETLEQLIRRLRLEKGLKQKELAQKISVSATTVYNWENDRKGPSEKK
jgi:hypothetical protein